MELVRTGMKPLSALLLQDDKPGHFHCSEAILAAAQRLRPVTVEKVQIRRPWFAPPPVLTALINRRASPAFVLKRIYGIDAATLPKADLIVSAGGDTIAANIALARLTGSPNIFFGSLRRFTPADFTLALNSYAIDRPAANQLQILKPSPADPAGLPVPDLDHRRLPKVSGLLVGGDSGDVRYTQRDWDRLLAFLGDTHVRLGMAWIVSNSRRTPEAVSDRLAAATAAQPGAPILRFIDVRRAGSGTLSGLFADSGAIAVTSDSSAMLSEAIWMRRPVVALRPEALRLPKVEQDYRSWLERNAWCREIALPDLTAERYASALREVIPLADNPLADLARLLATRLPALIGPSGN
jgi:mitochondrial fission protein ELM1